MFVIKNKNMENNDEIKNYRYSWYIIKVVGLMFLVGTMLTPIVLISINIWLNNKLFMSRIQLIIA